MKRRSRKCTDTTRGQSQFEFSCRQAIRRPADLCWYPQRPTIKHQSTHPGLAPVKGTSDHAYKVFLRLRASAGWPLRPGISWPAACPPRIRVFVVCLCSLSDGFDIIQLGMLTALGTLKHHRLHHRYRTYLGVTFKQRRWHLPKAILIIINSFSHSHIKHNQTDTITQSCHNPTNGSTSALGLHLSF